MTERKYPRIGRTKIDLEPVAWQWLREGRPAALAFVGWLDAQGRRVGDASEVWERWGASLVEQVGETNCAYAIREFGRPPRRRRRAG
jgi:hypothetical protein